MSTEIEYSNEISEELFLQKIEEFTQKFGEPKVQKRLALKVKQFVDKELEITLRITNGTFEIMQKIGRWDSSGLLTKEEKAHTMEVTAEAAFKLFQLFQNVYRNDPDAEFIIMQFEQYIFDNEKEELKLFKRYGPSEVFGYEIEVKDETIKDIQNLCAELGLPYDPAEKDKAYWLSWNKRVNLNAKDLEDEEILELIRKYLDKV